MNDQLRRTIGLSFLILASMSVAAPASISTGDSLDPGHGQVKGADAPASTLVEAAAVSGDAERVSKDAVRAGFDASAMGSAQARLITDATPASVWAGIVVLGVAMIAGRDRA